MWSNKKMNVELCFTKIKNNIEANKVFWIGIFITTILFLILYHKFLFEGYAYAYSYEDIGTDTVTTYIPKFYFISNILHNGEWKTYYLQYGFGSNMMSILQSIVNPFDLLVVLFKPENIYSGILLSTFFKYIVIMIFAIKYFGLFFKRNLVKLACAVLWTFCSYIVVWGQHYGFATVMTGFTIFMYYFHLFLNENKVNYKFIISMVYYITCSYYFFYSSGIFVAIYTIAYLLSKSIKFKEILIKLFKLLVLAILSLGISAVVLLPVLVVFFQSDRTASLTEAVGLLSPIDLSLKNIASLISRLISSDMIGNGFYPTYFSGPLNYYEFAFLSSSVLIIYALVKFVIISKRPVQRLLLLLIIIIALLWPGTNYLFCLDNKMRWTYILILPMILLIGDLINDTVYDFSKKDNKKIVAVSMIIYICASLILILCSRRNAIVLNKKIFLFETLLFLLFGIILLRWKFSNKFISFFLLITVTIDLTVNNYHSINDRGIEKIDDVKKNYYFDGSEIVASEIVRKDTDLYRMNKNFDSKFYNDAYVQGYNGVASYDSFNTKELCRMMDYYKVKSIYDLPHYQRINVDRTFLNSLFGVKYLIYDEYLGEEDLIASSNGKFGYLNKYWIPFGFLYDNQIHDGMPIDESLLMGDYSEYIRESSSLFDYDYDVYNGKLDNMVLVADNDDPQIVFTIPDDINIEDLELVIDATLEYNTVGQIFYANNENFDANKAINFELIKGNNKIHIDLSNLGLDNDKRTIRVDLSTIKQEIEIGSIEFLEYDFSEIISEFEGYRKNAIKNFKQNYNSFDGSVENKSKSNLSVFIPIVYSGEWKAYLDGEEVDIINKNGFISFEVTEGIHEIKLVCNPTGIKSGIVITFSSLFIAFFLNKKYHFLSSNR